MLVGCVCPCAIERVRDRDPDSCPHPAAGGCQSNESVTTIRPRADAVCQEWRFFGRGVGCGERRDCFEKTVCFCRRQKKDLEYGAYTFSTRHGFQNTDG